MNTLKYIREVTITRNFIYIVALEKETKKEQEMYTMQKEKECTSIIDINCTST